MRIFITGVSGLLGLNAAFQLKEKHDVSGVYHSHPVKVEKVQTVSLDLLNASALNVLMGEIQPNMVLHTAGLANVDSCEKNNEQAARFNVEVSENVARAAQLVDATLVHISTDHLGDGTKAFVAESQRPVPVNQYARTKWLAEKAVSKIDPRSLIIRTNFFGWGTPVKASLSDWVLDGLQQQKEIPLFVDVHITPILINYLLDYIEQLATRGASGVYNIVGCERISKYEFGVRLAKIFGFSTVTFRPASVEEIPLHAPRPTDMSLSSDRVSAFLGHSMPSLTDSLLRLKALGDSGWPKALQRAMTEEAM